MLLLVIAKPLYCHRVAITEFPFYFTKCLESRVRFNGLIHWLTVRPGKEMRHHFQCVYRLISFVITITDKGGNSDGVATSVNSGCFLSCGSG